MSEARYSKASLPHDNVYSIQGLLGQLGLVLPAPDYHKNVADVYQDATVAFLEAEGTLDILQQVHSLKSLQGLQLLPSWAPDWSLDKHAKLAGPALRGHIGATKSSTASFSLEADNRQLRVRGIIVDSVQERAARHLVHDHEQLGRSKQYPEWTLNEPLADEAWDTALRTEGAELETILRMWNVNVLQSFLDFVGHASHISEEGYDVLDHTLYGVSWDLHPLLHDRPGLR